MEKKKNMITDWLDQHGNREVESFIAKNLAIVDQIHQVLADKGWSQADFAKAMDKRPSEVSKWLSGMHNLTLKSITKMETTLGMDLVHTKPKKEVEYGFVKFIENYEVLADQAVEYQASAYDMAM